MVVVEYDSLHFCMTLLFAEYTNIMLSLPIAIDEFVGSLAFSNELRLPSPRHCHENPPVSADREAKPPGFGPERFRAQKLMYLSLKMRDFP